MSHRPSHEDEPDYRSVLDDSILTPDILRTQLRPQSSAHPSGHGLGDPVAITRLISTIGGQFGLTPSQISQVDRVIQQPDDLTRQIALMCFLTSQFASIQQVTVEHQQSNPVIQERSRTESPEPLREWKAKENVRSFIRDKIKELLMKTSIQAYSTANAFQHDVAVESLEDLVMEQLMKPNTTVKDRDLPPHFRASDLAAEVPVRKVIKEIAKSEKSKFQNGLLENIKDPKIGSLVPTLISVYFEVGRTRGLKNRNTCHNLIWNNMEFSDKARFALLRLEGTIYHLSGKNSTQPRTSEKEKVERSMWDRVDERLYWLRHLDRDKQDAFNRWIMKCDTKLFTGRQTFEQIKQSNNMLSMITTEQFEQWILAGEPDVDN